MAWTSASRSTVGSATSRAGVRPHTFVKAVHDVLLRQQRGHAVAGGRRFVEIDATRFPSPSSLVARPCRRAARPSPPMAALPVIATGLD